MKRITYYQSRTFRNGKKFPDNLTFVESRGIYAEITDTKGKRVELALEYDRSEKKYFATELTTGVGTRPLGHKDKDELLRMLSGYDWEHLMSASSIQKTKELLEKHKENLKCQSL